MILHNEKTTVYSPFQSFRAFCTIIPLALLPRLVLLVFHASSHVSSLGISAKFRPFISLMVVKSVLVYDITYIFSLFFCL